MLLTQKTSLSLWAALCLTAYRASGEEPEEGRILKGPGMPCSTTGALGDYYLDLDSALLYGAKTEAGWGQGADLTGKHPARYLARTAIPAQRQGMGSITRIAWSDWVYAHGFNDFTRSNAGVKVGYIVVPEITAALLQTGVVLLYMTNGEQTFSLPYNASGNGSTEVIHFIPMPGKILITRFVTGEGPGTGFSTLWQYRYMILPGGIAAARAFLPPDYSDYKAVCRYFGISL